MVLTTDCNEVIWSPDIYSLSSVLAKEVEQELLSRLDWMMCQPSLILDIGCGLGGASRQLQARYPEATVIGIDITEEMVGFAARQVSLSQPTHLSWLCAAAENIPFLPHTVDLLFANFLLPWCKDAVILLKEWRRLLKPEGLLMMSALGPDTLKEWPLLQAQLMPACHDMHVIGDLLLQLGLKDPVLDVCQIQMRYLNQQKMIREWQQSGMLSAMSAISEEETTMTQIETSVEVIFAHAFGSAIEDEISAVTNETRIPLASLRQQLHNNKR